MWCQRESKKRIECTTNERWGWSAKVHDKLNLITLKKFIVIAPLSKTTWGLNNFCWALLMNMYRYAATECRAILSSRFFQLELRNSSNYVDCWKSNQGVWQNKRPYINRAMKHKSWGLNFPLIFDYLMLSKSPLFARINLSKVEQPLCLSIYLNWYYDCCINLSNTMAIVCSSLRILFIFLLFVNERFKTITILNYLN